MLQITKLLTAKKTAVANKKNLYIVVHYTASPNGKASAVASFFKTSDRKGSAHYVVDDTTIYQCVEDSYAAWSVGDTQKYPCKGGATLKGKCTNSNSISIEMCCDKTNRKTCGATDTDWFFTEKTVANTVELIRYLQKLYSIPDENVVRHADVTGKYCPNPFVVHPERWAAFKQRLKGKEVDDEVIEKIKVKIDGREVEMNRILKDGKNHIELRAFAEALGCKVDYDTAKKMPIITR